MECPRCHNQESRYLYSIHGEVYCRKCIQFHRVMIDELRNTKQLSFKPSLTTYHLSFCLSPAQQAISQGLVDCFKRRENAYVWAVCGSGKTEIVFEVMRYALSQGCRVCFCVPRKELVKELYERIQDAFKGIDIGVMYGGVCEKEDAQFIVCTMHQLYRFENGYGFDLMVADEIDAFPFYNNEVLNELFERCCVGSFVKMSATIDEKDIHNGELFILNRRYHNHDLPMPKRLIVPSWCHMYMLLILIKKSDYYIVYVPTIAYVSKVVTFLNKHHICAEGVSSLGEHNDDSIKNLKEHRIQVLVSTTLLERGITIENIQVIVMYSNHVVYDWRTLVQIAGRVGRKPQHPDGFVYILSPEQTIHISKCLSIIKRLNKMSV